MIRDYQTRRRFRHVGVIVDPSARIFHAHLVTLGAGTEVQAGVDITPSDLSNGGYGSSLPGKIVVGERCFLGKGTIMAAYGGAITIGNDVSLNPYCVVYGHGGLTIGDCTRIAAGTIIIPANHIFRDPNRTITSQGLTCNGISIGRDVWIGSGVRILDGVSIGDGCVIGAGAVVTKSVPAFSIVVGVPAKVVGWRDNALPGQSGPV